MGALRGMEFVVRRLRLVRVVEVELWGLGIPRFSPRSITAVMTFMGTAIGTQTILLKNQGYRELLYPERFSDVDGFLAKYSSVDSILESLHLDYVSGGSLIAGAFCSFAVFRYFRLRASHEKENPLEQNTIPVILTSYVCGILFSLGLSISGM